MRRKEEDRTETRKPPEQHITKSMPELAGENCVCRSDFTTNITWEWLEEAEVTYVQASGEFQEPKNILRHLFGIGVAADSGQCQDSDVRPSEKHHDGLRVVHTSVRVHYKQPYSGGRHLAFTYDNRHVSGHLVTPDIGVYTDHCHLYRKCCSSPCLVGSNEKYVVVCEDIYLK